MSNQPLLIKSDEYFESDRENNIEIEKYRKNLSVLLYDSKFQKADGFPIGEEGNILHLSDPPFFTLCPNPFIKEIVEKWKSDRIEIRKELGIGNNNKPDDLYYHREPFAADISEGKNNPIYNSYSYHTKVPHQAILRYLLHYTDPGDIVFDGFCGTGMTGVAAQFCTDRKEIENLGYYINPNGKIFKKKGDEKPISRIGIRRAILSDLSPAATFISYNYNTPIDNVLLRNESERIISQVKSEYDWMYETWHPRNTAKKRIIAKINFTVWSDVFQCPECGTEMVFWDVAVIPETSKIRSIWPCPNCGILLGKKPSKSSGAQKAERARETIFDTVLGKSIRIAKQSPVLINYSVGTKRFEKSPDDYDLSVLEKLNGIKFPFAIPVQRMPDGDESRRNDDIGITHVHHFYTRRNLFIFAALRDAAKTIESQVVEKRIYQVLNSINNYINKKQSYGGGGGGISGTLYVGSLIAEKNIFDVLTRKIKRIKKEKRKVSRNLISTGSSTSLENIDNESVDYIFIDPPFGGNLMYSELNYIWEAWLGVFTYSKDEAIISKTQRKGMAEYQGLMEVCFNEFNRVLKPGRWMTVEFHNSKNAVWNAIQEGLLRSGFMVADIRILDKQQGTFKQVNSGGAVKQDLIISAYKPSSKFEQSFLMEGGSIKGVWAFIRQHLNQLPIPELKDGILEPIQERFSYLLFDRMIAFHVQRGLLIPLSAPTFYQGLSQRFIERDGMYFLPEQVVSYDAMRLKAENTFQINIFVVDEKSAIQWLRQQLDENMSGFPQTFPEIQPKFLKQLQQVKYENLPELINLLEQNFLQDEKDRWYVPNPNKASDLEEIRRKSLLREFAKYLDSSNKLKLFRKEAIRIGFADAWQRKDFKTIISIAERLPEAVLQEDPDLLMYYDNASLRVD